MEHLGIRHTPPINYSRPLGPELNEFALAVLAQENGDNHGYLFRTQKEALSRRAQIYKLLTRHGVSATVSQRKREVYVKIHSRPANFRVEGRRVANDISF